MTKRGIDIVATAGGLLVLSPILLFVAILVKLDSPGPVLFRQVRVGKGQVVFTILKFRSMRRETDRDRGITVDGDDRVTRVGKWLRRHKLDELPQMWNVLVGEMSLVGPRPEIPAYVKFYTPTELRVFDFLPGMTDPASLRYRDEGRILASARDPNEYYREVLMRRKLAMNVDYQQGATVGSDLTVILRTLWALSPFRQGG
jgi:lipopolysaccharide/colanic/teichoic acid biosynthesis glycosyltransferase